MSTKDLGKVQKSLSVAIFETCTGTWVKSMVNINSISGVQNQVKGKYALIASRGVSTKSCCELEYIQIYNERNEMYFIFMLSLLFY